MTDVDDLIYLVLTLAVFAALALLVGALGRLDEPSREDES